MLLEFPIYFKSEDVPILLLMSQGESSLKLQHLTTQYIVESSVVFPIKYGLNLVVNTYVYQFELTKRKVSSVAF